MHTLWSMSLQFWFHRSSDHTLYHCANHSFICLPTKTHTQNRTCRRKLGTNTGHTGCIVLFFAAQRSLKNLQSTRFMSHRSSSSARTGPGPSPGPLRWNVVSVRSRNIFWTGDLKHIFCCIPSTGTRIWTDSVMHPRSSSRGRNTSASVTV